MSRQFFVILFYSFSTFTYGQKMIEILRKLPNEPIPHIMIDSLEKNNVYFPPDNSKEESIRYSLSSVNDTIGTLRIEMVFDTGQRGFGITELRRFRVKKNEFIVIYSSITGAPIAFGQDELITYRIKNGQVTKDSNSLLPRDIGLKDFVKLNTPDSVISKYSQYSSQSFELINYGNNICFILHDNFDFYGIDKSWLLGNRIEFVFQKNRFKRSPPYFQNED
jgi:hypothetical protein